MRKLVLGCALVFSFVTNAQTKGSSILLRGGYAYSRGAENLYTSLSDNTVSGFTDQFSLLGIEVYHRRNKWIAGIEATAGAQKAKPNGIYSLKPFNSASHVHIGYILYKAKDFWFYPSVGIGASRISLSEREKILGKTSKIDDVHLNSTSFDFGLNLDFLTTKQTREQKRAGGLILGLRAGYRFSPKNSSWENSDGVRQNEARFRNNSYYATLVTGVGFFKSK